jgi:hypothetical protein
VTTVPRSLHQVKLLAALRRVNKQLALWDELDAMELMPNSLRPHVEQPSLSREQLESIRQELLGALNELQARDGRG